MLDTELPILPDETVHLKGLISISPLEIVGFESDKNLRELSWNIRILEKIKKDYDLAHGEAVIFRNVARDRFRMVVNFFGIPNLIIPPIDSSDKCSLDLKIAQFLRRFRTDNKEIVAYLDAEMESTQERLARRKLLAKKAIIIRKK